MMTVTNRNKRRTTENNVNKLNFDLRALRSIANIV